MEVRDAKIIAGVSDRKIMFVKSFANLLSRYEHTITDENHITIADGVISAQNRIWRKIWDSIKSGELRIERPLAQFTDAMESLIGGIPRTSRSRIENGIHLKSTVPIFLKDLPESIFEEIKTFPMEAAAILMQRCENYIFSNPNLVQKFQAYLLPLKHVEVASILDERIGKIFELQSKYQSVDLIIERLSSESTGRINEYKEQLALAKEALQREVAEYTKISSSIDLWRTKARWHWLAFSLCAIIFIGGLVSVFYFLNTETATRYFEYVKNIPADHYFQAIAMLAIPAVAAAWLLRFFARLSLQSFNLAHDARQRHAQVTTYLRLLGDSSKPISERERILALAALFRPLPGQGSEDVSPPTVAELIKDAHEKLTR